jgi:hypothetical protein
VRPVLIARLQRLLDQQPAKAGTVDEEVALDLAAVLQAHRFDEPVLAAQRDVDDLAFEPGHALGFGIMPEEAGIEARVEMEGVEQLRERRARLGPGRANLPCWAATALIDQAEMSCITRRWRSRR